MKTRAEELQNISGQQFDLCVIGGGATGSACALDAQLRGIRTVLLEAGDFAGATSSAATKIIHGGVRYLEEAIKDVDPKEYHVVVRALHERVRMLDNAPHLTRKLEFLVPSFHWLDVAYLDIGPVKTGNQKLKFPRSEEHTSELQSRQYLVCRLLLDNKT